MALVNAPSIDKQPTNVLTAQHGRTKLAALNPYTVFVRIEARASISFLGVLTRLLFGAGFY